MFDVSNDFKVFDWTDSVQYYSRTSDNTYDSPQTINSCLHREENKTIVEGFLHSDMIHKTTTYEIWSNNVDFIPVRGDKISDSDNNEWTVLKIDYCDRISRYRLFCQELNQGKDL